MSNHAEPHSVTEFGVIELNDGKFPSFFIDHSGLVNQFQEWLESIALSESTGLPIDPCILIEPPKSGKTALMTRIAPMKIHEAFPNALICSINFVARVPTDSTEDFGLQSMEIFIKRLITALRVFCLKNDLGDLPKQMEASDIDSHLLIVFEHLDSLGKRIFFLWDEVQVWFNACATRGTTLFDQVTFHMEFKNLRFCVTGSAMVIIYRNILTFPSNGNSWTSAMNVVASDQSADPVALKSFTLKLLKERYPDLIAS